MKRPSVAMTIPTIHLNGTSADELMAQLGTAEAAVREAISALAAAGPNARDYYVQGSAAFTVACDEHDRRVGRLRSVADELDVLWASVYDQQLARSRR